MNEFLSALVNPDIPFFRYAFIAGILASFSFGVIGSYVVTRRTTYIAGAIAHSVLGGIGIGLFLQVEFNCQWCQPMIFAVITAVLAALIIGWVSLKGRQREDTVIGAIWALGMAIGLIFLAKTPGYVDPMSYLFGNILLISKTDLYLVIGLDILVLVLGIYFYNHFLAICFDDEYARLRGINVEFFYLLLLSLTALTVVLLVRIVGIVMVIALLTLPAAVAGNFVKKLWQMMALAVIFCMVFVAVGLAFSFAWDLPSGPVIILFAGLVYLLVLSFLGIFRRRARG